MDSLLEYLNERGITTLITTNGLCLKEHMNSVISHKVRDITISIDTHEEVTYARIRGKKVLSNVLKNLEDLILMKKQLHSEFPYIGLNFVILPENFRYLVEYYNFFVEKYPEIDRINFQVQHFIGENIGCEQSILQDISDILSKSNYRFLKNNDSKNPVDKEYMLLSSSKRFNIHIMEAEEFTKCYKGYGNKIFPFASSDIEKARSICIDRPLLYNGRIYSCSKIALLEKQLKLTGQFYDKENIKPWIPYVENKGIAYDDDKSKVHNFIKHINGSHEACRSCPSNQQESKILHKKNVFTKSQWDKTFWNIERK